MRVGRARRLYLRWERHQRRQMLLQTSPVSRYGFHLFLTMGYVKAFERYQGAGRHPGSRPPGIREVRQFLFLTPRQYRGRD